MRTLLILLLLFPFVSNAQINRSAKELASERIGEYITTRLFKGQPYQPVLYGELKSSGDKQSAISWVIAHKFEITVTPKEDSKNAAVRKPYKFLFYLDEKMKVVRAETAYSE